MSALHSIRKRMWLNEQRQDAERQLNKMVVKDPKFKEAMARPGAWEQFLKQVMAAVVDRSRKKSS